MTAVAPWQPPPYERRRGPGRRTEDLPVTLLADLAKYWKADMKLRVMRETLFKAYGVDLTPSRLCYIAHEKLRLPHRFYTEGDREPVRSAERRQNVPDRRQLEVETFPVRCRHCAAVFDAPLDLARSCPYCGTVRLPAYVERRELVDLPPETGARHAPKPGSGRRGPQRRTG